MTIRIRGHHIPLLPTYLEGLRLLYSDGHSYIESLERRYGTRFYKNLLHVLTRIANGQEQIVVVDSSDDLCGSCKFRGLDGCRPYGEGSLHIFTPNEKVAEADRQDAIRNNFKINRGYDDSDGRYDGLLFLRKLRVR